MRRSGSHGRSPGGGKEYLLEFVPHGKYVKVSAIDPDTGVEVSIVGPADGGEELLSRTAVRKLKYVLAKRRREAATTGKRGFTI